MNEKRRAAPNTPKMSCFFTGKSFLLLLFYFKLNLNAYWKKTSWHDDEIDRKSKHKENAYGGQKKKYKRTVK